MGQLRAWMKNLAAPGSAPSRRSRGLGIPDQQILLLPGAADDISPIRAEAHIALARNAGASGGGRGRARRDATRGGAWPTGAKGLEVAGEGVEEEVAGPVGAEEDRLAVVRELKPSPVASDGGRGESQLVGAEVESSEGGLIVVAQVVEEDGGGGCGGDGDDSSGGVEGSEVGGRKVQFALGVRGVEGPEADGIVLGAGEKSVRGRGYGDGGDGGGVGAEVADVLVVVGGEVADGVVAGFGAGVEDALGVVGEAGEVGAVFFGEEGLHVRAFAGVVELEGVVVAGG